MSGRVSTMELLNAIQQVVGHSSIDQPVVLHEPGFHGTQAWSYVKDCLDTGWVSTGGQWVRRFEHELSVLTGAAHVIAVTNGTVALRLALHLVGVVPGDEVWIPPLSFVATANAVAHLGAIPHFVDVEPATLGMDPAALADLLQQFAERQNGELINRQTGRRIAAVMPVHVFGHPADIKTLRQVADSWGIPMVEDAAEALGSWKSETHCGLCGAVGTLSFNGNKLITTGGGGALLTNDADLAHRARHLSTTAKIPHPWLFEHDAVGWNDRMPSINAALGVAQLEDLDRRLIAKRQLAESYQEVFKYFDDIELIKEPPDSCSNNWLISIRFTSKNSQEACLQRTKLLEVAHQSGLMLRPIWNPLHHLPMYKNNYFKNMPVSEDQAQRILNLPSSPQIVFRSSQDD